MEEKIIEYLEAFEAAVVQFGPQAADLGLAYIRADSLSHLVLGLIFLGVCWVMYRVTSWCVVKADADDTLDEHVGGYAVGALFAGAAGIGSGIAGAINAFYPWNWIGTFAPQLRLVHEAIERVG